MIKETSMQTPATEFGVNKGLPGLARGLTRFIANLAADPRLRFLPAPESRR